MWKGVLCIWTFYCLTGSYSESVDPAPAAAKDPSPIKYPLDETLSTGSSSDLALEPKAISYGNRGYGYNDAGYNHQGQHGYQGHHVSGINNAFHNTGNYNKRRPSRDRYGNKIHYVNQNYQNYGNKPYYGNYQGGYYDRYGKRPGKPSRNPGQYHGIHYGNYQGKPQGAYYGQQQVHYGHRRPHGGKRPYIQNQVHGNQGYYGHLPAIHVQIGGQRKPYGHQSGYGGRRKQGHNSYGGKFRSTLPFDEMELDPVEHPAVDMSVDPLEYKVAAPQPLIDLVQIPEPMPEVFPSPYQMDFFRSTSNVDSSEEQEAMMYYGRSATPGSDESFES